MDCDLQQGVEVRFIGVKGFAVVATQKLYPGTLVHREKSAVFVPISNNPEGSSDSMTSLAMEVILSMRGNSKISTGVEGLCGNMSKRSIQNLSMIKLTAKKISARMRHVDTETIELILDKILSNVFTVTGPEMNPLGAALYIKGSKYNHSCAPNAHQSFIGDVLIIRVTSVVEIGEEICISYVDTGQSTAVRRAELLRSYCFMCYCPKCSLGDQYNGYKCLDRSCRGICSFDEPFSATRYRLWLSGELHRFSPLNWAPGVERSWMRHLPCSEIVLTALMFPSYAVTDLPDTVARCSVCGQSLSLKKVLESVMAINEKKKILDRSSSSDESRRLEQMKSINAHLRSILFDSNYAVMESLSALVLELIKLARYTEAANLGATSVNCFKTLYPLKSHVVAIQELQIAKLHSCIGNINESRRYLGAALESLRVSIGEDHELYQEALRQLC
jgi:hypothetical protein